MQHRLVAMTMRYLSHIQVVTTRTLDFHYIVMRQRHAPTFSSCSSPTGGGPASGHRPDAGRPAFPGPAECRPGGSAAKRDGLDEDALAFALLPLAAACARADLSHLTSARLPAASAVPVLRRQYGISRRHHAANRARRTKRHQPRPAARRKNPCGRLP